MQLNHLDLAVPDVALTRDFFQTHLGFTCIETLGRDGLSILRGSGGMILVLSRQRKTGASSYPEGFHIGFHLESEAAVHEAYQRMTASGVDLPDRPTARRGALGFYFHAPGEILVEIGHRPGHDGR